MTQQEAMWQPAVANEMPTRQGTGPVGKRQLERGERLNVGIDGGGSGYVSSNVGGNNLAAPAVATVTATTDVVNDGAVAFLLFVKAFLSITPLIQFCTKNVASSMPNVCLFGFEQQFNVPFSMGNVSPIVFEHSFLFLRMFF